MIIVEGPDGAGKSTLCDKILDTFNIEAGERGTTNRDELYRVTVPDTYLALRLAVTGRDTPLVWDRLFFSEFIYPKYMGRSCQFSDAQRAFITKMLDALGCPIIWCMPPRDVVIDNALKDHQMDSVNENIANIWDDYDRLFHFVPRQALWYDYTAENDTRILNVIENYIKDRKEREW